MIITHVSCGFKMFIARAFLQTSTILFWWIRLGPQSLPGRLYNKDSLEVGQPRKSWSRRLKPVLTSVSKCPYRGTLTSSFLHVCAEDIESVAGLRDTGHSRQKTGLKMFISREFLQTSTERTQPLLQTSIQIMPTYKANTAQKQTARKRQTAKEKKRLKKDLPSVRVGAAAAGALAAGVVRGAGGGGGGGPGLERERNNRALRPPDDRGLRGTCCGWRGCGRGSRGRRRRRCRGEPSQR